MSTSRKTKTLAVAGILAAGVGVFVYVGGCAQSRSGSRVEANDPTYVVLMDGGNQAFRRLETSGPCKGGIGWVGGYFRGTGAGTCAVSLTSESGLTADFEVALAAESGTPGYRVTRILKGPVSLHNDTVTVDPQSCPVPPLATR
jgi:hypothetical protein